MQKIFGIFEVFLDEGNFIELKHKIDVPGIHKTSYDHLKINVVTATIQICACSVKGYDRSYDAA